MREFKEGDRVIVTDKHYSDKCVYNMKGRIIKIYEGSVKGIEF